MDLDPFGFDQLCLGAPHAKRRKTSRKSHLYKIMAKSPSPYADSSAEVHDMQLALAKHVQQNDPTSESKSKMSSDWISGPDSHNLGVKNDSTPLSDIVPVSNWLIQNFSLGDCANFLAISPTLGPKLKG